MFFEARGRHGGRLLTYGRRMRGSCFLHSVCSPGGRGHLGWKPGDSYFWVTPLVTHPLPQGPISKDPMLFHSSITSWGPSVRCWPFWALLA